MFEFSPQEIAAIWLSLKIASIAVIFSLPFAIAIAWLLSRKEFWGKNLLNGIVHLPLVLPAVLGFARSLGEFGATITFVSNIPNQTQTIPAALFTFIETPNGELAAARLCLVAICISLLALFASEWLAQRQKRYAQA